MTGIWGGTVGAVGGGGTVNTFLDTVDPTTLNEGDLWFTKNATTGKTEKIWRGTSTPASPDLLLYTTDPIEHGTHAARLALSTLPIEETVWVETDTLDQYQIQSGAWVQTVEGTASSGVDSSGIYRAMIRTAGRSPTSNASGNKYWLVPGVDGIVSLDPKGNLVQTSPIYTEIVSSELALTGKTPKLRVKARVHTGTAPAVTYTLGLYPVTSGASVTLGTVVSGSTAAIASPAANTLTGITSSGDFDIPSDGTYAIGYTVSGTPAANAALYGTCELHYV